MEIDVQCSVRLEQGSKLYLQNELDYVKMYLVVQKSWKAQAVKLQAEGPPWAVSPVTSLAWLLGCSELGGPTGGHLSFLHVTQSGSLGPSCARPWGSRTESCSPPPSLPQSSGSGERPGSPSLWWKMQWRWYLGPEGACGLLGW